jgi:hypothetical protein
MARRFLLDTNVAVEVGGIGGIDAVPVRVSPLISCYKQFKRYKWLQVIW